MFNAVCASRKAYILLKYVKQLHFHSITSMEARLWRASLLWRVVDGVSAKALLMSAMLMTESWATEVRSYRWPQCDSASW